MNKVSQPVSEPEAVSPSGADLMSDSKSDGVSLSIKEPRSAREVLLKGVNFYKLGAIVLTNTIITVVLANLFSDVVLKVWDKQVQQRKDKAAEALLVDKYHDYTAQQLQEIQKENNRTQLYEYAPYVGYKQRPVWMKYMHITPPGFRWCSDSGAWPPDPKNTNVFVYGASTTFGSRVTDDETIPARLQEYLKGKGDKPVKVYNFGTPSFTSTLERIQFANMLAQGFVPDIAVFIDGNLDALTYSDDPPLGSEMRELMEDRGYGLVKASRPLLQELPMTKLVSKVRGEMKKQATQSFKIPLTKEQVEHIVTRYIANKRLIEAEARDFGVKTLFVWQPCSLYHCDSKNNPFPEPDFPHPDPALTYERMAEKVKESTPAFLQDFVWLADIQKGVTEPCFLDKAQHYRANFCKQIGVAIGKTLVDRNYLTSAKN